jgi:hypothetical protein
LNHLKGILNPSNLRDNSLLRRKSKKRMMKLRAEKTKREMLHLVSNKTLLYQMINSKQFKIRNKKFVTFQAAVRMKRLKDNRREKLHIEAINRQNLPIDMIKLQLLGSLAQSRHTS